MRLISIEVPLDLPSLFPQPRPAKHPTWGGFDPPSRLRPTSSSTKDETDKSSLQTEDSDSLYVCRLGEQVEPSQLSKRERAGQALPSNLRAKGW